MDWTRTNISATIDFDAEGKHTGDLRLSWSNNEKPLGYHPVPVAVIKNGAGPTLLLTGGVHGDEYEGPAMLMRLLHSFDPELLRGRLIILPALNTPAVSAGTRNSPLDDGNLNRAFPGSRSGPPTAMIAHFMEDVVLPECDAVIDFHSGGNAYVFTPLTIVYLGARTADKTSLALAQAFNAPYTWAEEFTEQSTFSAAAIRQDVPMFATELGGGGNVNPGLVQLAEDGLLRVMDCLGLLDDAVEIPTPGNPGTPVSVSATAAVADGLYVPGVEPGQTVKSGEPVGAIYSVTEPEREPSIFGFSEGGIILSVVNRGMVRRGDVLALVGKAVK